ncbi:hypothetical protein GCM10029978_045730 [Actinoallomurus acanthiterrae]
MATDPYRRYCSELSAACAALGLATSPLPTQVRIWDPDFDQFAELITCKPGPGGVPSFFWSFGAAAGPASEVRTVAALAVKVVSPRLQGLPTGRSRR